MRERKRGMEEIMKESERERERGREKEKEGEERESKREGKYELTNQKSTYENVKTFHAYESDTSYKNSCKILVFQYFLKIPNVHYSSFSRLLSLKI